MKKTNHATDEPGGYHPGNLTVDSGFKQDDEPAFSDRVVIERGPPVLFDANGKPLYRKVGFTR